MEDGFQITVGAIDAKAVVQIPLQYFGILEIYFNVS